MAGKKDKDSYRSLADSLTEESLREAADTFFGQRRGIETALQAYEEGVQELLRRQQRVAARLATLHFLLRRGDSAAVDGFYRAIDVDPDRIPKPDPETGARLGKLQLPFGLHAKSRYAKLVCEAYAALAEEAADFMQGRYYPDPQDPRCMRVTLSYAQLRERHASLCEEIRKANAYSPPSEILQYCKRLSETDQARSGICVPLCYTLDREMAFAAPDFGQSGLVAFPAFPAAKQVKRAIKGYCSRVFASAPEEIRRILETVRSSEP
jgi:hypothetical protein